MMFEPRSKAEHIAALPAEKRAKWLSNHKEAWLQDFGEKWSNWCRPEQVPPPGEWMIWLMMAGRGFGKTRAGAEWVRAQAMNTVDLRIALVGANFNEARTIMVEGESGLLNIGPEADRPKWEPSNRRLLWNNGASAYLYSAAEPEMLRGPEHHIAWADEIGKWGNGKATWDNLMLTMRLGHRPRIAATTTPRAVPLVRHLIAAKHVVITRGRTTDNKPHMPRAWMEAMQNEYEGSRFGRQELQGELIDAVEGALWQRHWIEGGRVPAPPPLRRVVIGVDPPASASGDACGIIAVGLGEDGRAYVLGDHSAAGLSPHGWAQAVATAAARWDADRVIAEKNNGGDMVESTLRSADIFMPVKLVSASHGKVTRAEPVAALYESGKVSHVGAYDELEDELCGFVVGGDYQGPGRSPDRADALVWAMKELMPGRARVEPRVRLL